MLVARTPEIEAYWQAYRKAKGIEATDYHACSFASPAHTDKLDYITGHCVAGHKRGTAHLVMDFEITGVPRRQAGDHWVVLDGELEPVCVVRLVKVEVKPFDQVGDDFAARENEGDGSLNYWATRHRLMFQRQCADWGREWREDLPTVCESFDKVWPA